MIKGFVKELLRAVYFVVIGMISTILTLILIGVADKIQHR